MLDPLPDSASACPASFDSNTENDRTGRLRVSTEVRPEISGPIEPSPEVSYPQLDINNTSPVPGIDVSLTNDSAPCGSQHSHASNAQLWKATLDRAVKGIVNISYTVVRSFDLDGAGSYNGTGFIVDSAMGLILSNRHVVKTGPVSTTARFNKYEELTLTPLYFDPVHDFGFFKYDPSKIKYAEVEEIKLCPEAAKVGTEIKICGNDAGEHGTIWGSTLARLDRRAPQYDFNTFYIQAASSTAVGSSGSPVLDIFGRAVALHTGGVANSATSLYLPLDRVVRALHLLQNGKRITRGTLQTEFVHLSYDELKKLGLPDEIERESRKRNEHSKGLLTVHQVIPEGPCSAVLQVGDVLVKCYHPAFGERYIENFVSLWEIIDESIGDTIGLTILRGKDLKAIEAKVQDLNDLMPHTFLEVMDGIVHPISYHVARQFFLPCRGLFVAASGMSMIPNRCLIRQIDNTDINSLDDIVKIFQSTPHGKRVSIRYRKLDTGTEVFHYIMIDKRFFCMTLFHRTENTWERRVVKFESPPVRETEVTRLKVGSQVTWKALLKARLLRVHCRVPYQVQGVPAGNTSGIGVLVVTDPIPLVVVSRSVVPASACDIWIIIGNRWVSGRVVYLGIVTVVTINGTWDPGHNVFPIGTNEYKAGDQLELFALDGSDQLVQFSSEIREIGPFQSPTLIPPRSRTTNVEVLYMSGSRTTNDGVLLDRDDKSVLALWLTIDRSKVGLDYNRYVRPIIEALQNHAGNHNRSCGWQFSFMPLTDAVNLGLDEQRATSITELVNRANVASRCFYVAAKLHPIREETLKLGDIILEVNGKKVIRMADIHTLSGPDPVQAVVLRGREQISIRVKTECLPSALLSRIIFWAGAVLHETHQAALELTAPEFEEIAKREGITNIWDAVYVSSTMLGSPAYTGIIQSSWILEVDGRPVRTMDDMLTVVQILKNQLQHVRVKMLARNGNISVLSVRPGSKFWPPWMLEWKDMEWHRTDFE